MPEVLQMVLMKIFNTNSSLILVIAASPHRELASPHRDLVSPHRDLASPHRDLGVPHRDLSAG